MTLRDSLLALLVMAMWGINFVVAKWGLAEFPPLFLQALRFSLVAALVVPFVRVPRGKLRAIAALSVTLGSLHFPLMFSGLNGIDAATASLAAQAQVPFSSLLAAVLFKDKLGWRRMAGMAGAFAGVAVIAGEPRFAEHPIPLMFILGASFAFAVASMQMKTIGAVDGATLNGWMALFAAPQLLVLSLLLETGQAASLGSASLWGWGSLLYMAVGVTIVAYGIWLPLLRRYAVNQTMPYLLTVPVFGVAAGVLLMDDPFTLRLVLGGLLTVGGVAVIVKRRPATVAKEAANPT